MVRLGTVCRLEAGAPTSSRRRRPATGPAAAPWITDDAGGVGGIPRGARFVIAGDFNADPLDGDSTNRAAVLLLEAPWIDASCKPASRGGAEAAHNQGGKNAEHRGDPALDTADFNDRFTGNLRIDYVLPSANLKVTDCGVHWPARDEPGHDRVNVSDHRLVWLDVQL